MKTEDITRRITRVRRRKDSHNATKPLSKRVKRLVKLLDDQVYDYQDRYARASTERCSLHEAYKRALCLILKLLIDRDDAELSKTIIEQAVGGGIVTIRQFEAYISKLRVSVPSKQSAANGRQYWLRAKALGYLRRVYNNAYCNSPTDPYRVGVTSRLKLK